MRPYIIFYTLIIFLVIAGLFSMQLYDSITGSNTMDILRNAGGQELLNQIIMGSSMVLLIGSFLSHIQWYKKIQTMSAFFNGIRPYVIICTVIIFLVMASLLSIPLYDSITGSNTVDSIRNEGRESLLTQIIMGSTVVVFIGGIVIYIKWYKSRTTNPDRNDHNGKQEVYGIRAADSEYDTPEPGSSGLFRANNAERTHPEDETFNKIIKRYHSYQESMQQISRGMEYTGTNMNVHKNLPLYKWVLRLSIFPLLFGVLYAIGEYTGITHSFKAFFIRHFITTSTHATVFSVIAISMLIAALLAAIFGPLYKLGILKIPGSTNSPQQSNGNREDIFYSEQIKSAGSINQVTYEYLIFLFGLAGCLIMLVHAGLGILILVVLLLLYIAGKYYGSKKKPSFIISRDGWVTVMNRFTRDYWFHVKDCTQVGVQYIRQQDYGEPARILLYKLLKKAAGIQDMYPKYLRFTGKNGQVVQLDIGSPVSASRVYFSGQDVEYYMACVLRDNQYRFNPIPVNPGDPAGYDDIYGGWEASNDSVK